MQIDAIIQARIGSSRLRGKVLKKINGFSVLKFLLNQLDYSKLLNHLDIKPSEFLMIGNSLKSDVLPLVNISAHAIHVPFHTTWAHEQVTEQDTNGKTYKTISSLRDVIKLLD